jgi:hypothetical protein
MLERKVRQEILLLVALLFCTFGANIALAKDKGHKHHTKTVNCNKHNASVQSAIDKVKVGQDTTIFIVGFCDEHVSIVKDGITLSGNKDGNGMVGGKLTEITVTGAQRVQIEYLELAGAGSGVGVGEGASVTIKNSDIIDNEDDGVGVYRNAFARLESNMITRNGQKDDEEAGIQVYRGGIVRSSGNYVANNGYAAVEVGSVSYFRSFGGDILLQKDCLVDTPPGEGSTCGASGTVAVDCYRSGVCDFRDTHVTGNIGISGLSNFEARTTSINGDVHGKSGSRLHLRNSVIGSGWVSCETEAFASGAIGCESPILTP